MGSYEGSLHMPGDDGPGLGIQVDLTGDRLRITAAGNEIGDWSKEEVRLHAATDGFHLRAEGEEVILDLTQDAHFALDYGLKSAPPMLRRKMASLLREDT